MTQAEKLQKLIELAWDNGWDMFDPSLFSYDYCNTVCNEFVLVEKRYAPGNEPEMYQVSTIIFDHEFIKALCKAKYGEYHWDIYQSWGLKGKTLDGTCVTEPYEGYLCELALSENRIDYLYGEFCE